ncbi:hypothetical protein [Lysobacter sp. CA199]|uniref:hypothetical protein n=1 Tax=Lysobacter sp. CA199 TaxID=3455608 RepID=UPI003F8D07A2
MGDRQRWHDAGRIGDPWINGRFTPSIAPGGILPASARRPTRAARIHCRIHGFSFQLRSRYNRAFPTKPFQPNRIDPDPFSASARYN